jgi:plasmid stabilization system protein ParE
MKGLPVFYTALAEEDLDHIEDYISAHDLAAAARVRATIVQQTLQLGNTPKKGMALKEPRGQEENAVRIWPVPRYRNYLVLYRIEPERIRVLRILHAAQDWTRYFSKSRPISAAVVQTSPRLHSLTQSRGAGENAE